MRAFGARASLIGAALLVCSFSARGQVVQQPAISFKDTPPANPGQIHIAARYSPGYQPLLARSSSVVRLRDGTSLHVHTPTFHEVADTKFWLVAAGNIASSVADIEGAQRCIHIDPGCRESNPMLGSSRAQQYGVKMAMNALFLWTVYRYKRREMVLREAGAPYRRPPWWVIGNAWTALNVGTAAYNWRLSASVCSVPGACPSPGGGNGR